MGCVGSYKSVSQEDPADKIETITKKPKQTKYKLVLLGPGESGKTTILRQLRRLYGDDFTRSELVETKPHIMANIIEAMRTLAVYSEILYDQGHDTKVDDKNEEIRSRVARMNAQDKYTNQHSADFHALWNDVHIQNLLEFSYKFQLLDTCKYFFEKMDNYWRSDYVPTFEDLIHTRRRSTGVKETRLNFVMNDKITRVSEICEIYDVGGQKTERKKWTHFLQGATAIIYVAALSGYNQTLWEQSTTNRMKEAIALFGRIFDMVLFGHSHHIIFLNKSDLFYKKVGIYSVAEHFEDYTGNNDTPKEIIDFFKGKFMAQCNRNPNKKKHEIHFHITCAIDTECIKRMFESVRFIVVKEVLRSNVFL